MTTSVKERIQAKSQLDTSEARALREQTINTLRNGEVSAMFYKDINLDLYHESPNVPDTLRSYTGEGQSTYIRRNKPKGALWLSTGDVSDTGKVATDWRMWKNYVKWGELGGPLVHRAQINENALIVELNEKNYAHISKILRGELPTPAEIEQYDGTTYGGGMRFTPEGKAEFPPVVPWLELKNAGVDLVRVNGYENQGSFYGWDCDSVVVLNAEAVQGWDTVPAEEDEEMLDAIRDANLYFGFFDD